MVETCSEMATTIQQVLDDNKVVLLLEDVFFGDQQLLPRTPSACVIPGPTEVQLVGAPRRVDGTFEVQVLVYHCKLQDSQVTELECAQRGEAVAALLNTKITFGGKVIDGFCTNIEPGYVDSKSSGNWYKTTRITWRGFSRFNLPLVEAP